ncbi:hypothetical protein B0J14DRAFT_597841 [Halenospora varia]|nr:hypothetical protein B0J14DRAFT_597841 [Halenospora varia]
MLSIVRPLPPRLAQWNVRLKPSPILRTTLGPSRIFFATPRLADFNPQSALPSVYFSKAKQNPPPWALATATVATCLCLMLSLAEFWYRKNDLDSGLGASRFLQDTRQFHLERIYSDSHPDTIAVRELFKKLEGFRLDFYPGDNVVIVQDAEYATVDITLMTKQQYQAQYSNKSRMILNLQLP